MDESSGPSRSLLTNVIQNIGDAPYELGGYAIVLVVLVLLSGLISGSEVAFFSIGTDELFDLQKSKRKRDGVLIELLSSPKQLLASILISNNLINVAIVTISTVMAWKVAGTKEEGNSILIYSSFIVTFVIVFFGEVIPKIYANSKNISFARRTSLLVLFLSKLFYPVAIVLLKMSNMIESRIEKKGYDVSVDDLSEALEMTTDDSSEEEKDILKGVVKFGTIHAKQIMRTRLDVTAIDYETDFHQLMDKINKCGFSRIPVYKESIDHIVGILYIKDILPFIQQNERYKWQKLLREPYFIPENKKIDDLLRNFQELRVHMAIVVDEYAGTSGLITLEDVIEEIVGEISDEFDSTNEVDYNRLNDNTFIFEAKTSLNDFTKILEIEDHRFDEVKGESESLAGLLLELNEELPNAGDTIDFEEFTFTIESANDKRIKRVRIKINQNEEAS